MKKYFLILLAFSLFACDSFVNDYTEPNDSIGDDQFKTAGDAQFLITGVRGLFSEAYDQATSLSGGLSDELRFTRDISGASFVTFDEIDRASTLPPLPVNIDNNSITGFYLDLHRFRKHTELLIDKTNNSIVFEEGEESIKASALYTGYFYSAIAKYMLGAYFGLEIDQPGNVIDAGPFMSTTDLYNEALSDLTSAEANASESQVRMINTFRARIYMLLGETGMAASAAAAGMTTGDASLNALYNLANVNDWHFDSGNGRIQWYTDARFGAYLEMDPAESARIPMRTVFGTSTDEDGNPLNTYYIQLKYEAEESPIRFIGWQENELILAELAIAGGDAGTGLTHINNVRAAYGLSSVDDQYVTDNYNGDAMELLMAERDKEFYGEGMRLLDQRRWNKWHLPLESSWLFLPIPLDERNANSNL